MKIMEIGWIMFGFFIFITMVFIVVAVFLPEWVGITGKKAQEYIREHGGNEPQNSENSTPASSSEEPKK